MSAPDFAPVVSALEEPGFDAEIHGSSLPERSAS
jgi:hypothetical protein